MKRRTRTALARWMREHGWTQVRIAAHVGCSQSYICKALRGEGAVGLEYAVRIADLTGFPVEDIANDPTAQRILEAYVDRLLSQRGIAKENASVV